MGGNTQSILFKAIQKDCKESKNWYEKRKLLGTGTFGDVFLCCHNSSQREFAMKTLNGLNGVSLKKLQIEDAKAFDRELCMKKFFHDKIIEYYGYEVVNNQPFIYMEYCDSGSLATIYEEEEIPIYLIGKYTRDICLALKYLHSLNYHHHDVKCANIVISGKHTAKLCDFGAASLLKDSNRFYSTANVGGNYWCSPELRHKWEHREPACDIWSLGVTVLEMHIREIPTCIDNLGTENRRPLEDYKAKMDNKDLNEFLNLSVKNKPNERATIPTLLKTNLCNSYKSEAFRKYITEKYENLYKEWSESRVKTNAILSKLATVIDDYLLKNNITVCASSVTGIGGAVLSIVGAALIPVTFGASLGLLIGGLSVGVVSGSASGISNIMTSIKENKDVKHADDVIKKDSKLTEKWTNLIMEIYSIYEDEDNIKNAILEQFSERPADEYETNLDGSRNQQSKGFIGSSIGSIGARGASTGTTIGFRAANMALDALPIAAKFSIALTGISAAVDVGSLIYSSVKIHKRTSNTGNELREIEKTLSEEYVKMKKLHDKLRIL